MFFDPIYWVMIAVVAGISGLASLRVKGAFAKYNKVRIRSGVTGAQAAHAMLRAAGLENVVEIQRVEGFLSDHYDPRKKVVRLSPDVHDRDSIAAVGVACHEVGHAIQDAKKYKPLVVRNAIVPTASIGSNLGIILVIIGIVLGAAQGSGLGSAVAVVGLGLFSMIVIFQLVNLPVEFNASARAKEMLPQMGIISGREEAAGVDSVLGAAAMTYVAATIGAMMQLLYWAYVIFGNRR
jgi:hypothetical protein